jgi:hypothetical protein
VQAKKRKNRQHDDNKADEIDDTVHGACSSRQANLRFPIMFRGKSATAILFDLLAALSAVVGTRPTRGPSESLKRQDNAAQAGPSVIVDIPQAQAAISYGRSKASPLAPAGGLFCAHSSKSNGDAPVRPGTSPAENLACRLVGGRSNR